jgi:hypothetical protein
VGQQVVDLGGRVILDAEEHVAEIVERVDAVRLARRDEGVEAGDVVAGVFVADKEVVLAAKGDDAEGGL